MSVAMKRFGSSLVMFIVNAALAACSHPAAQPAPASPSVTAPAGGHEGGDDDDVPVTQAELPAPVQATVTVQAKGATIHGLSKSMEDGHVTYELELVMANGHRRDMDIDPQGAIREVEEEVALDAVPDPARAAIVAKAGARKVTRVEALSSGEGTLYGYEVGVTDGAKRAEFRIDLQGKPLPDDDDD